MIFYIGIETTMLFGAGSTRARTTGAGRVLGPHRPASSRHDHVTDARQLGPRTTQTETSRPVIEDKSARKRGLVGPYVKTTQTVLLIFNCK